MGKDMEVVVVVVDAADMVMVVDDVWYGVWSMN